MMPGRVSSGAAWLAAAMLADGSVRVVAGNPPALDKSGEPIVLFTRPAKTPR